MRWMLDTNTCIDAMKHHSAQVQARLRRAAIGEVGISAIAALVDFLAYCLVLDWTQEASMAYAENRHALEGRGAPIAHALQLDCTLVTNNPGEFRRVDGSVVENWIGSKPA